MRRKITRRTFLMGVGGGAALASFGVTALAQVPPRNVLWIVDDDHPRYMMDSMPVTRRKIRDKGSNFALGHADVPLCGPGRVSLLTGLSVTTHRVATNKTWQKFAASPLGLGERTVARYMKDAGYATGHFGKYLNDHWGMRGSTGHVPAYWDRWVETTGGDADTAFSRHTANVDGSMAQTPPPIISLWAADRCADFIRSNKGGSWFAQYCPQIPHSPYTPSGQSEHLYDGARRRSPSVNEKDMSDKPLWMRNNPPAGKWWIQASFEGKQEELADLDRYGIVRILDALRDTGQLQNTVIFFTSDNGYLHGEHRLKKKDKPYWESAEIPFFVKGPGVRARVRAALVSHVDLMPTTAGVAGIPFSSLDVDGRSMLSNLGQETFTGWRKRMLVTGSNAVGPDENPGGANDPSGEWWLLRNEHEAFILRESGYKELYWMKSDPHQLDSKAWTDDRLMMDHLTDTVEAMRVASGQERRRLEER